MLERLRKSDKMIMPEAIELGLNDARYLARKAFMFSATQYRTDIQILRGMAVLAVVLFHAKEDYFPLGYLGVDVFFVISGFVITPLLMRIFFDKASGMGRLSKLKYFYKRRFYRLAPALAVTLAISALSMFLLAPISDLKSYFRQSIATLLLAGNFSAYRYSGDYFSQNPNPLIHTWSLSVEEQIYIFLPLILFIFIHNCRSINKAVTIIFGLISSMSFISFLFPTILEFLYSRAGIEQPSQFSFYSPLDRIWQFTLGGLAFLIVQRYQNREKRIPKTIQILAVICMIMFLFGPNHLNLQFNSILATLIATKIIIFKSLNVLSGKLISKLKWIGDRSYSIYLVHMPLLYLAQYSPVIQTSNNENRIVESIIGVCASILVGALIYSKVEKKYRDKSYPNSTVSNGILKVFISVFIVPLTIFILLLQFSEKGNVSMYKDRSDDGTCKFWTPYLDANFHSRFAKCQLKFGQATVVLGDSHAMNIYNALFLTTPKKFFVGIAAGGCRPDIKSSNCPYENFKQLINSSPKSIDRVIFHQSGSYLISDHGGNVDTNQAFKSQKSYRILDSNIEFLLSFLNDMGKSVNTTWIGPFPEIRVEPTWLQVKANQTKPNPIVRKAFLDLEEHILLHLKKEQKEFRYVSLIETLGNRQFEYKVGSCILFRDIDHWSTCGEKIFSLPINQSLQK